MKRFASISIVLVLAACGSDKKEDSPKEVRRQAEKAERAAKAKEERNAPKEAPKEAPPREGPKGGPAEQTGSGAPGPNTPRVADAPEGNPPPDGKYEKVMVDGKTVPMIQIMDKGTTVLVDIDGKKPRSWEEQYKNKKAKKGQLDIHKTDANKNGKFEDDPVDKEGIWLLDVKGNITKH
jgi:hypothetical protein